MHWKSIAVAMVLTMVTMAIVNRVPALSKVVNGA